MLLHGTVTFLGQPTIKEKALLFINALNLGLKETTTGIPINKTSTLIRRTLPTQQSIIPTTRRPSMQHCPTKVRKICKRKKGRFYVCTYIAINIDKLLDNF